MKYEMMVILDPSLNEKDLAKTLGEIKGTVEEHGYKFVDEDVWGMKDFAYKIKGHTHGYYVVWNFEGEAGEGTIEIKKDLMIQTGLLRYLLIKVADDYVLMQYDEKAPLKEAEKPKLSKHAEELQKKVTGKAESKPKPKLTATEQSEVLNKEEAEPEKDLDEKLQAIIDDTDIDL